MSAWKYLHEHGGIELDGRDEGLDDEIRRSLNPVASSRHEALSQLGSTSSLTLVVKD